MAERTVVVANPLGLHVRPSTALAQAASKFRSLIRIVKDGQAVNAKSSIELLTLAAVQGSRLVIQAEGEDAETAVRDLGDMIEKAFGEK